MAKLGDVVINAPVLVTGANGYLGSWVLDQLYSKNVACKGTGRVSNSRILGCDLTNRIEVESLFKKLQPCRVIHCAAEVPKTAGDYYNNKLIDNNLLMAKNIANTATCPICFVSSMTVYNGLRHKSLPYSEIDAVLPPVGGYALAKWEAELMFSENCTAGFLSLRLPGLFGPPRRSGLLYKVAKSFLKGNTPQINAPFPLWAALDVRDAAKICADSASLEIFPKSEFVNVGYEGVFSVPAAVDMLADICQTDWPRKTWDAPEFEMELSRLGKYFGLFSYSFRQRLERMVEEIKREIWTEKNLE